MSRERYYCSKCTSSFPIVHRLCPVCGTTDFKSGTELRKNTEENMNPHTQHPQRCETCNHNKKSSITGILVNCTFHEITLSDSDTDLICVIGCASHSEQEIQVPDCPYHQYQCAWDGNPEQHYCKRDEKLILRLKEERQEEREGVLVELAEFLDNTDNTSDSGNAQKWVSLPVLFKWMQSKGWRP